MSMRLKIAGKGALAVALVTGGAVAALALQPSSALAQKKYHMKIGMATIKDPQQAWGERIGAEVMKRTNGQVTYQVFPASQLGKIPRQVEGIQLGTQEVFLTPPGFFVGVNQAFMVPDAPGLFLSQEHGHKTLTDPEFHDTFLGLAEKKGVVGAGLIVYEGTSIASTKAIRTPEDISGMKIRVLATPDGARRAGGVGRHRRADPLHRGGSRDPARRGGRLPVEHRRHERSEVPDGHQVRDRAGRRLHPDRDVVQQELAEQAPRGHPQDRPGGAERT